MSPSIAADRSRRINGSDWFFAYTVSDSRALFRGSSAGRRRHRNSRKLRPWRPGSPCWASRHWKFAQMAGRLISVITASSASKVKSCAAAFWPERGPTGRSHGAAPANHGSAKPCCCACSAKPAAARRFLKPRRLPIGRRTGKTPRTFGRRKLIEGAGTTPGPAPTSA